MLLFLIIALFLFIVCVSIYFIILLHKIQKLTNEQFRAIELLIKEKTKFIDNNTSAINDKIVQVNSDLTTINGNVKAVMTTLGYIKDYVKPTIIKDEKKNKNIRVIRDYVTGAEFTEEIKDVRKSKQQS